MKVIVCGSRDFANPFAVSLGVDRIVAALPAGSTVIHGAARGADTMADEAARRHGHTVEAYPADWNGIGKSAGIIRNRQMLDQKPDRVIAFWNGKSRGTQHTVSEARRLGIEVELYTEGQS